MKRVLKWAALLAVLLLAGWALRLTVLAPETIPVEVYEAVRGVVEETVSNTRAGTVRVRRRASIGVDAPGTILAIERREGEEAATGEVLIRVDDREARAALKRTAQELDAAEADRKAVAIRCEHLGREAARLEKLHQEGVIAEDRTDSARTASRRCGAEMEAARERVSLARATMGQAEVALERTVVRAPFDGVVNRLFAEEGEYGTPGKPVLDLMERSDLYVRAEIDEVDLARVREGLPVRVTLDPFRGRSFAGAVRRVATFVSEAEQQNRTIEVDVDFAPAEDLAGVKPGTSADVEVILISRPDVLRVPRYALLKGDRLLVFEEGRAVERRVEVGLKNWDYAEIRSGLREGERVIVSLDREGVRAGVAVRIEGDG